MKTKLFTHKLLVVGTAAALGLCLAGTALAGAKTYSTNELKFQFTPLVDGNPIAPVDIGFNADPNSDASATKDEQPDPNNILDLDDADGAETEAEACVGILPGNPDCKVTKPNIFTQHEIAPGHDFCRGKANIPFIPAADLVGIPVEDAAEANATSECQFDRQNWGQGDAANGFSGSFTIDQPNTTMKFDILADPRMESFCHADPSFNPQATARMTFTITIFNANNQQVFAFNPDGIVGPGEDKDEASLNLAIFCNTRGQVVDYDPIALPGGNNDCTATGTNPGGDPALCEYSSTTPVLATGAYTMVVSMTQNSDAHKEEVPPMVNGDHFLCYKSFGHFLREDVDLLDQFDLFDETGAKNFDVLKPKMFCNPAIKPELDPDAVLEPGPHYLSYKINEGHRVPRHERKMAEVQNQFGTMIVETFKPDRLMVPSGKSLVLPDVEPTPIPAIPAPSDKTNHYKCYKVRATGFQSPGDVAILDQFTDPDADFKRLRIVRPTRLCVPVEKTRSDGTVTPIILNPDNEFDHQMCYSVTAARGERLNKKTKVLSNNQFGSEELVLKRELEFCVPTKKTLLTPGG